MARYEFRWENVPSDVLRELAAALDEPTGHDPLTTVEAHFGECPTPLFVRESWPVLLRGWLLRDDASRGLVCAELSRANLGDREILGPGRGEQVNYLQTCPSVARLWDIVLQVFTLVGAPEQPAPVERIESAEESGFDLDDSVERAWAAYAKELVSRLADLDSLQQLENILEIPLPSPRSRPTLDPLLPALEIITEDGLFVAIVKPAGGELRSSQTAQLQTLGFQAGDAEYLGLKVQREAISELVAATVAALRDVFAVPHPSFLDMPGTHESAEAERTLLTSNGPVAITPASEDEFRKLVDLWLHEMLGEPARYDDRGDVPIRSGSAMVFVRTLTQSSAIEFFSPLLSGVDGSALNLERLNRANDRLAYAKLVWVSGHVIASARVFCRPFVRDLLTATLQMMVSLTDDLDDRLQAEVGGRKFLDDPDSGGESTVT